MSEVWCGHELKAEVRTALSAKLEAIPTSVALPAWRTDMRTALELRHWPKTVAAATDGSTSGTMAADATAADAAASVLAALGAHYSVDRRRAAASYMYLCGHKSKSMSSQRFFSPKSSPCTTLTVTLNTHVSRV